MKKTAKLFLWTAVFFLLFLGADQLLVKTPEQSGAVGTLQSFYRDFRERLFHLGEKKEAPPAAVEEVLKQVTRKESSAQKAAAKRYIYADENGQIVFAESLSEVPERFRKDAKAMEVDP